MIHQLTELYRLRDFGEKLNATVQFIRYNFTDLLKVILLVAAPFGLVLGIIFKFFFQIAFNMGSQAQTGQIDEMQAFGMMGSMGGFALLMVLLSLIAYGLSMAAIMGFMRLKHETGQTPTISEVYSFAFKKLPGIIGLMIVIYIIIIIGFVFLIIPGIYLSVVYLLAIPSYIFQDIGFGDALSKPFKLIKEKWWSTFGLFIISGLIASFCSYIFMIPYYALSFGELFTMPGSQADPNAVLELYKGWKVAFSLGFAVVGGYITYMIPIIAISYQYTNLRERLEGTGLKSQIENFESLG